MTTPQKIKFTFDKLFSSGVNQVIYHGTPYAYFPEGYPKEGWYPFYSSALGINFSSNISESNPFWGHISQINQYAQRAQYVLRSGKPNADVLIYYPFLNYSEEVANPKEVMIAGYLPTEPPLPQENKNEPYTRKVDTEWLEKIMPLIDELNQRGITWDWINDASIQEMSLDNENRLKLRDNIYQSLILFDLPYIQLQSAEQLLVLSKMGANLLIIGDIPAVQPSFFNYQQNDQRTYQLMSAVAKKKTTTHIREISQVSSWASKFSLPISYVVENGDLRQQRRKLNENSYAQFIWNENDSWSEVCISTQKPFAYNYWLDAKDGSIRKAAEREGNYSFNLAPYSSIIFLTSTTPLVIETTEKASFNPKMAQTVLSVSTWNIQAGEVSIADTMLFDWKTHELLKYNGEPAVYSSTFVLDKVNPEKQYFLDLGTVYYAADIRINGQSAGSGVFMPFISDITPYLQDGENTIQVTVTTAAYNDFVGQAEKGEKVFKQLKKAETLSSGLIGPVKIWEQ